ncbi:MAG: tRNA (guanosine(37)-N1)-methyltransferase TrmD [Bacilli bacterium]|nr:tRNA (guanosine(37)-N1)-methyltransferase TrmD [Bacilli bacterium]MBN2696128.1 tRNA (guanosine(37)-N1)-methyltransferase TrmD [Bacilli bacterium]
MKISILTLFPEMFKGFFSESIIKRAIKAGKVEVEMINFRDFSTRKHQQVDDTTYGGGAGMVLAVEPIYRALQSIPDIESAVKILLTPQGEPYHQERANTLAQADHIVLVCGHYEGFDDRIRNFIDLEISIGDYVLTGGEIPAMAIVDSVIRLLPGVLTNSDSYTQDSFYDGMLEYPQYTKPYDFMGYKVPDVLISGNHQEIDKWRRNEAEKRTRERRPDLLEKPNKKH